MAVGATATTGAAKKRLRSHIDELNLTAAARGPATLATSNPTTMLLLLLTVSCRSVDSHTILRTLHYFLVREWSFVTEIVDRSIDPNG